MAGHGPQKHQVIVPNIPFVPGNPYKRKGAKTKLQLGSPIAAQFSYPSPRERRRLSPVRHRLHNVHPRRSVSRSRSRSPRRHGVDQPPIILAQEIPNIRRPSVQRRRSRSHSPQFSIDRERSRFRTPPVILIPDLNLAHRRGPRSPDRHPRSRSRSPSRRYHTSPYRRSPRQSGDLHRRDRSRSPESRRSPPSVYYREPSRSGTRYSRGSESPQGPHVVPAPAIHIGDPGMETGPRPRLTSPQPVYRPLQSRDDPIGHRYQTVTPFPFDDAAQDRLERLYEIERRLQDAYLTAELSEDRREQEFHYFEDVRRRIFIENEQQRAAQAEEARNILLQKISGGVIDRPRSVESLRIIVPDSSSFETFSTAPGHPLSDIFTLVTYTLPHFVYLHILLRLPKFYYARVANIFVQCELMLPDIQQMAVATSKQWKELGKQGVIRPATWDGMAVQTFSPALSHFKDTWETFIEALLREWNTLNIISALVLPTILTVLQINSAVQDPIARTAALISLICALMSLLYGCLYIMRFGTMRQPHKAASWAMEAQKLETTIIWSPWVMLAMPAIWLCWSLISFLVSIMTYVWRSNSVNSPDQRVTSAMVALGTRTAISCVLGLGLVCLIGIVSTFSSYGDEMDEAWSVHVEEWANMLSGATIRVLGDPNRKVSNYYDHYGRRSRRPSPENMPTTAGILPHEFQHQQSTRNSVCREPPLPPPGPVKVAPETSSPIPPEPTTTTLPFRLMSIESSPNVDDSNIIFILKAFYIFTAQDVPIPLLEKGLTLSEWRQLYFTSMSDGSTSLTSQNAELVTVHATEPSAFRPEPPNGATEPPKQEANVAFNCIKQWNREIFAAKGLQAVICRTIESPLEYAVYIIDAGKTETISEGQEMIVEGLGNDGRK